MPEDPHHLDKAFTDLTRDISSRVHAPTSLELIGRASVQRGRRAAVAAAISVAAVVLGVTTLTGRVPIGGGPGGVGDGSSSSSPTTPSPTTPSPTTPTTTATTVPAFLTATDLEFLHEDLRPVDELPPAVDWAGCVPNDLGWQRAVLAAGDDYAVASQIAAFEDEATAEDAFDHLVRGLEPCVFDGRVFPPSDDVMSFINAREGGVTAMMTIFDLDAAEESGRHRFQQVVLVKTGRTVAVVTVHSVSESPPNVDERDVVRFAMAVRDRIPTTTLKTEPPVLTGPTPDSTVGPRDTFWERRLIATFRRLGAVDVGVVQHEFRAARVGGSWRGDYVTVYESNPQVRSTPGQFVRRIDLGRTTGVVIRGVSGPFVRFSCGDRRYEVSLLPHAAATHYRLPGVERFIRELLPLTCEQSDNRPD